MKLEMYTYTSVVGLELEIKSLSYFEIHFISLDLRKAFFSLLNF